MIQNAQGIDCMMSGGRVFCESTVPIYLIGIAIVALIIILIVISKRK